MSSSNKRNLSSVSTDQTDCGGEFVGKKRPRINLDFDAKFIASSQDDLDIELLRIQNRRLAERHNHRLKIESELRNQIEHLEKKQLNDDTKLYVINRYWNQLNEDMRLLLERFEITSAPNETNNRASSIDANSDSTDDENEDSRNESTETASFVRQLANIDKEELDEQLEKRVLLSTTAVSKVLKAFDRIVKRNEKVMIALKECSTECSVKSELSADEKDSDTIKSPDRDNDDKETLDLKSPSKKKYKKINLDETVRELNEELTKENKNLNNLVTSLHEKYRTITLKHNQLNDKIESKDFEIDELKNRIDGLEFELNKYKIREQRLEGHLIEAREKLRSHQDHGSSNTSDTSEGISSTKIEDLKLELEEQKEMASSRLVELEQLNNKYKETLKLLEKYKIDLQCLPDSVIKESAEFKSLQSHFSVLFNESMQLKTQLEETRQQLSNAKNYHIRQIEQMEAEELTLQKRLRNECIQLEDALAQTRKEYDVLRLEFEQTLTANEQAVPINREMRSLITSLQNHTQQLKGENSRIKKKLKESNIEVGRLKQIIEQNGMKVCCGGIVLPMNKNPEINTNESTDTTKISVGNSQNIKSESGTDSSNDVKTSETGSCDQEIRKEKAKGEVPTSPHQLIVKNSPSTQNSDLSDVYQNPESTEDASMAHRSHSSASSIHRKTEDIRELKSQLKKSWESQKEMRLLLDTFRSVDKEKRDKVQLIVGEKKLRSELEELRQHHKKCLDEKRSSSSFDRRMSGSKFDEEHRKINKYEEIIKELQKNVTIHKQQEEALLNEMEVTGQAFEDMQEQNCRLIQQLREKDDANFKLMSERIKSNQIHKLLKEEKEILAEQIVAQQNQIESQNQVVRKLEEKERILQNTIALSAKELSFRQQAMDCLRRKAVESTQSSADLRRHLDKYWTQIQDAQSIVADKTSAWQQEAFKTKRLHEEVLTLKRKYERAKKFELAATADEVLQEEIRELREELTCPSCKTKRKDAVLNKCFHVFCYDCLKTRYETRQRKCPKCNQSFSANDFHRLYLA
ncbi:C3H4 ring finger protein [Sarcoptes scabiei]|uniref:E3 ubiquitin protein ligase n=1 Tax=Sarcoptes scabiei TaxID=52283 RepID=A0A132AEL7_SARSC|nr:C3H4 ring finger protein [Sarcoptes scabiei]